MGGAGGGMHARGMILNGGGGWAVMNGVPGRPGGGGTTVRARRGRVDRFSLFKKTLVPRGAQLNTRKYCRN